MTAEQLAALGIDIQWLDVLNATFQRFAINTPWRQACFIGQCAHESAGFKILTENLKYSAQGLMRTWPKHFADLATAQAYANQPERIASRAYAGRLGNGDEASGDGWRYRGRGLIQLTGRSNYLAAGAALGADLAGQPDLVATPGFAVLVAGWFWDSKGLNALADQLDHREITRRINGGFNGLDDRIVRSETALMVLEG